MMRGSEEFSSTVLVLMMEINKKIKDWGYVKYGGEVDGGLSVGIQVDWVMRSRSRSVMRVQKNVK